MKRNEYILKRLNLLNIKSLQEGLLQLLNGTGIDVRGKTCLNMFLPVVENGEIAEEEKENRQPIKILDVAMEFCSENSVDCTSCKVFVNNICYKVKQRELWDFFEYFGKVLRVFIVKDRKTKRSKGFGFVVFSTPFDAQKAIKGKKHELRLNGRLMQVFPAVKKKKNEKNVKGDPEEAKMKLKEAAVYFLNESPNESEITPDDEKTETPVYTCTFGTLCDDIVFQVFSYLDLRTRVRVELVCKRWQSLAVQSWHQVKAIHFKNVFNLSHTHASLNDKILISILNKNCTNLASIDLSGSPYLISISSLSKLAKACPNLEEIDLSYVPIKQDSAKILGKSLNLRRIRMAGCLYLNEKGFWWLFKNQKRLEELEITDTSRLIGNCIYMLPSSLKFVNFDSCIKLNDIGVKCLANCCSNITNLDLTSCICISDDGLGFLLEKCLQITRLNLRGLGPNVTPKGFRHITNLKKLSDLDISRNLALNDDLLNQLASACKDIVKLNIEACHGDITRSGIRSLLFYDKLQELNISYLNCVTDEDVKEIALEGRLTNFFLRSCPNVSDISAVACIEYLDCLLLLDLSGCFCITDEFASMVKSEGTRAASEKLQIILGGTEITEDGVNLLRQHLSNTTVTLENYQVGSLRNDRDGTLLVRPFYPESSDEEDEEEQEEERELIVLKPDVELSIHEDYPCIDEDGERLWETLDPGQDFKINEDVEISMEESKNCTSNSLVNDLSSNTPQEEEEENWDNEMEEGRVWSMPLDTTDTDSMFNCFGMDELDDFLENDDLSRLELIG